jgi:hypothetical protein
VAPHWHAVEPAPHLEERRAPRPLGAVLVSTAGIVLAVVLGLALSARIGALTLAATLVVAGAWRALDRSGPPGLVVRTRSFDVFLYLSAAASITFLALTAPGVG